MKAPIRRQPPLAPGPDGHHGRREDQQPHDEVKEPVHEGVHFQPRDRVDGVNVCVAHHVVPLQDLVQDDSVHKAAKTQAVENPRRFRRGNPGRSRHPSLTGHSVNATASPRGLHP